MGGGFGFSQFSISLFISCFIFFLLQIQDVSANTSHSPPIASDSLPPTRVVEQEALVRFYETAGGEDF